MDKILKFFCCGCYFKNDTTLKDVNEVFNESENKVNTKDNHVVTSNINNEPKKISVELLRDIDNEPRKISVELLREIKVHVKKPKSEEINLPAYDKYSVVEKMS